MEGKRGSMWCSYQIRWRGDKLKKVEVGGRFKAVVRGKVKNLSPLRGRRREKAERLKGGEEQQSERQKVNLVLGEAEKNRDS